MVPKLQCLHSSTSNPDLQFHKQKGVDFVRNPSPAEPPWKLWLKATETLKKELANGATLTREFWHSRAVVLDIHGDG